MVEFQIASETISTPSVCPAAAHATNRTEMYAVMSRTKASNFSSHHLVESCPRGYPALAAFLDSDECFSVYRRFGFLQSRLLLDKQDKLRQLEDALDRLDKREQNADPTRPMTNDLTEEEITPRKKLLAAIEKQYCSYGKSWFFSPSSVLGLQVTTCM
jgi:hypothetical protein